MIFGEYCETWEMFSEWDFSRTEFITLMCIFQFLAVNWITQIIKALCPQMIPCPNISIWSATRNYYRPKWSLALPPPPPPSSPLPPLPFGKEVWHPSSRDTRKKQSLSRKCLSLAEVASIPWRGVQLRRG